MSTHFKGTPAEITALDAYIKLMRAAESVTARAHDLLPADLTLTQFGVLEALLHRGPLCQSALAKKLLKSAGNLTLVVNNLEKAQLVVRERSDTDRRYITVALTAKGRRFITALFPKVCRRITTEMSALSASEQASLAALCKTVGLGKTTAAS